MGLTVKEMLDNNFFKDFKLLAGEKGLDKEIQGIATMDAPDGYNWTRGKELVISSGYIFKEDESLLLEYAEADNFDQISGLAIKLGRYIDDLPQGLLDICNDKKVPLLVIPMAIPWMAIMNQLNVIVMNKTIKQFRIPNIDHSSLSDVPYQELKINKILSQIENEMNFPAMIYDLNSEKAYYSSDNFNELSDDKLGIEDYWQPSFDYSYEILCDNLKITRFRFVDESKFKRPYSWITIPITVGDELEAYFVIIEAENLIDYFDEFVLRIGFIIIQSSYEQILLAKKFETKGFRKLVYDLIEDRLPSHEVIHERAEDIGLDIYAEYYILSLEDKGEGRPLRERAVDVESAYSNTLSVLGGRLAILDEDGAIIIVPKDKTGYEDTLELIELKAQDMKERLEKKYSKMDIRFGLSDIPFEISELKLGFERSERALDMGTRFYRDCSFVKYSDLGVFAWLDVKEDEFEMLEEDIGELLLPENKDLLKTLKVYLESNMNYSLTAKKLYIHINTVRNRINEIDELINYDLDDPMRRVKLEVLLKLIV